MSWKFVLPMLLGVGMLYGAEPSLESLRDDYNKVDAEFSEKYRAAKTDEERKALLDKRQRVAPTIAAMLPLLEKRAEDPTILDSLAWMIYRGRKNTPPLVFELAEKHKESKEIFEVLMTSTIDRSGRVKALVNWAREESEFPEVRGVAAYMNGKDRTLSDEERLEELRFAVANLGDLEVRGANMKKSAEGLIIPLERFLIGNEAPEIEGENLKGVTFKLSDYRGKVVVLDFWGHW